MSDSEDNDHVSTSRQLEYEVNSRGERVLICSLESTVRVYLRFANRTSRPVNVWWRDFRGRAVFYIKIEPSSNFDVNSFLTHPWFFTDSDTSERYVIDNKRVFRAPASIGGMSFRTNWNINVPLRSLKYTSMLVIAERLPDAASVNALELPRVLGVSLQKLKRQYDKGERIP